MAFRLFDLPQALQERIYGHLYAEKYDIDAYIEYCDTTHRRFHLLSKKYKRLVLRGLPSYNLELVCRKTRQDSAALRKDAFSGRLQVKHSNEFGLGGLRVLLSGRQQECKKWLLCRVLAIELSNFDDESKQESTDGVKLSSQWGHLWRSFVNFQWINFTYTKKRFICPTRLLSDPPAHGWYQVSSKGYSDRVAAGVEDFKFTFPDRLLLIDSLVANLQDRLPECKVYLTMRVRWMDACSSCVGEQIVKFVFHDETGERLDLIHHKMGLYSETVGRWLDGKPAGEITERLSPSGADGLTFAPDADNRELFQTVPSSASTTAVVGAPPAYSSVAGSFQHLSCTTNTSVADGAPPPYS